MTAATVAATLEAIIKKNCTRVAEITALGVTQNASVTLPALPTLPAFPPPTGGSFTVNSGTGNQAPGSFTSVSVNGGTLVLASGDY